MKKIVFAILILSVVFVPKFSSLSREAIAASIGGTSDRVLTYMLCGYDDAAENTDSIVLVSYRFSDNSMSFVQIPRDTYFANSSYKKINSVYPTEVSSGLSRADALNSLRTQLSSALGIRIDASIGYTMDTFVGVIDAIGGVDLVLPCEFGVKACDGTELLALSCGENHIDGKSALAFVRARNGYTTGDLGRVDAQKLFLSAFMTKLKNGVSAVDIVKACISTSKGWTVDARFSDLFQMLAKNRGRVSGISTKYATMPGKQVQSKDGIWYYSIALTPSAELLNDLGFVRNGCMDTEHLFLNSADEKFAEIYYSHELSAKIYNDSTLMELEIPKQ